MGKGCTLPVVALLAALLAGISLSSGAVEAFRWVDAEGRVHYGDHAPSGVASRSVVLGDDESGAGSSGLRQGEVRMLQSVDERPLRRTGSLPTSSSSGVADRESDCRQARAELDEVRAQMRTGYRASEYDEFQQRERSAKTQIRKICQ